MVSTAAVARGDRLRRIDVDDVRAVDRDRAWRQDLARAVLGDHGSAGDDERDRSRRLRGRGDDAPVQRRVRRARIVHA